MSSEKTSVNYARVPVGVANSSKKSGMRNVKIALSIVFIVLVIAFIVVVVTAPKNSYLKNVGVYKATISQMAMEESKYYIKIKLDGAAGITITDDNSWVEVRSDFYYKVMATKQVGVLLGYYDIFNKKYWGILGDKGQVFNKSVWSIEEVFENLDEAKKAYPYSKYTANATIDRKKTTKDGNTYLVVHYENRKYTLKVDKSLYDKIKVNQAVKCEFEAVGDFKKLAKIL